MESMGHQGQTTNTSEGDDHQRVRAMRVNKLRGTSSRRVTPNNRTRAMVAAISRLEQEHVALLMALCDLDEPAISREDALVWSALQILLREDLRRTQHALQLASQGMYGVCEICQQPLSRRHLSLLPAMTRCSACASRVPYEH